VPLRTITVRAHRAERTGNYITVGQATTMRLAQLPKDSIVVASIPTMFKHFADSPPRYEVIEADIIVRIP
jgi:hypothetical protein